MTKKNIVLHVNNYAKLGGIETTVIDIARAIPQFFHILLTINPNGEDLSFVEYVRNQHIEYRNAGGKLTEALVKEIDPFVIFLHNTAGKHIEGEYPYQWLRSWKVIGAHHMATFPLIPADLDWFISDWVRDKYAKCEKRMGDKSFTMPPVVWPTPYQNITRHGRTPVVGRIQSGTWGNRGKVSGTFYRLLKSLKRCSLLTVGPNPDPEIKSLPILPGYMPVYLKELDIMAIWGDTTESWSKVATEANMSGIPVVARNHNDGLAEQIKKSGGGKLVNTEKGFVENIQDLIDHPEKRAEMGARGRKWCLKYASTATFRAKFLDIFLDWSIS